MYVNLVGHNRKPRHCHHCMLGQLFGIIRTCATLQNEALISNQQSKVTNLPAQATPHPRLDLCNFSQRGLIHGAFLLLSSVLHG
jgi:hypothetical protein